MHYDFSKIKNFRMPTLIGTFFRSQAIFFNDLLSQSDTFPVITNVEHLSKDKVQITRKIMYKNYYNSSHNYPTEKIIVDRRNLGKNKPHLTLQSYAEFPGVKTEAMKIFSKGYLVKRCLLD